MSGAFNASSLDLIIGGHPIRDRIISGFRYNTPNSKDRQRVPKCGSFSTADGVNPFSAAETMPASREQHEASCPKLLGL